MISEPFYTRFPDGVPQSLGAFIDVVAGEGRNCWLVMFRNEIGGIVYLSEVDGGSGLIHFAFLPTQAMRTDEGIPVPVAMGRYMTASILRDMAGDEYIVDSLMGITPSDNSAAVKLVSRCGAVIVGEVPGACRIYEFAIKSMVKTQERKVYKHEFYDSYLAQHGDLKGADKAWRDWSRENPLFAAEDMTPQKRGTADLPNPQGGQLDDIDRRVDELIQKYGGGR